MSRASEAKIALKALIAQGIDQAIRRLDEILDPASLAYNTFVQLKSRYSLYLTNIVLGMTAQDELNKQYAQISHAFIIMVDGLSDADLKPASVPSAGKPDAPRRGELLYHIPRQMQEKREYHCAVRVAYLKDLLYQDWETHADDAQKNIRVAEVMSVELVNLDDDEPFSIRPLHNTVQFLDENDFTEWVFLVKPKHSGEFNLALRVSVIEIRDGREVKKDVVLEQHVIVATEAPAPEAAPQFANSGMQLDFTADGGRDTVHGGRKPKSNRGLRATALFLAFLMVSTSATWAFTPPPTRDWWLANLKNDAEAYAEHIKNYPESPYREKAFFYKADKTGTLRDLRDYQHEYPQGQFREKVLDKIETLEIEAVKNIQQRPEAEKISQFVEDFPESERLPELKQAVGNRAELLPALENAYVRSLQAQPTAQKVTAFLRDFPQSERLPEVATAAAAQPEVLRAVQPELENVIIQKVENANTAAEVEAVLPAMESAGSSEGMKKVEQAVAQKPRLKKQLLPKISEMAGRVRQRERQQQLSESLKLSESSHSESSQMSPAEAQDWATAEATNTARAYVDFVNKYPKTSKLPEARAKINALKPAMTPEEQAWADATLANSPQAYIYFVQIFPKGKRIAEARARIKTFSLSIKEQKRLEAEAAERQRLEQEEQARLAQEAENQKQTSANEQPTTNLPTGQAGNRQRKSGLTMVRVAGGTFTMGDDKDDDETNCEHPVAVKTFEIGKYEITQADWREVMGSDPPELYNKGCDDCPVDGVSWNDIQDFIKTLNRVTASGKKYRLPTEAEWEYAARGGSKSKGYTYSGSDDLDKVAWYGSNSGSKTHRVGEKVGNELGLYDMSGNVYEWCQDTWVPYPCDKETKADKSSRVWRGGSWNYDSNDCSVRRRYNNIPRYRYNNCGFRLAQDK